ncbi:MAG: hypothetical protein AB7F50_01720 [Fimbriimonadaceae bacterium]
MHDSMIQPILELDRSIPDQLFVLAEPETGRYGCFCFEGIHGLAVFSDEFSAWKFSELLPVEFVVCRTVSFDEAREIAKTRPMPVVSVMLLDDVNDPVIHYVR